MTSSATPDSARPLRRRTVDAPPAPRIRLVHIGLGAFHRAHQVFLTQKADPEWGYASFTGRSEALADELQEQDGLYTLVIRSAEGDDPQLITGLVESHPGTDTRRLVELISDPEVAVVTLTVTEAGYHLTGSGELDEGDEEIQADLEKLRSDDPTPGLVTAAGRVVVGLRARRAANGPGIAVMSCDNISGNGAETRATVVGFARLLDPALAEWIEENVTFPSTSIDRITPATTDELVADVRAATGFADAVPVVTEPFYSWIISGDFPVGRPAWERAGVKFVDDIEPFERRKLWLLNGAHSLMAYLGQLMGHNTVAEAIDDAAIRARVEALWDEAACHLMEVTDYRAALIERFANPRIVHNLAQIGIDGATKLRMRALPILRAERAAGRSGAAAAFLVAAWIGFVLRGDPESIADTRAAEIAAAARDEDPVRALVAVLDEDLARDDRVVELVHAQLAEIDT